jgi:RHS repeat-associated protein
MHAAAIGSFLLLVGMLDALAQPGPSGKVPPQLPPQAADHAQENVAAKTAPAVSVTAPAAGALYTAPAAVLLQAGASASSSGKSIVQVEFFAGATPIGSVTAAPYTFSWEDVAAGSYSLTARATDNLGVTATSAPVTVIVNAPPAVTLASPAGNALFTAPASITLTADATDTDGTIARVEFFRDAALIATVTSAPYRFALTDVAAGNATFSARATDDRGASASSAPVTVLVNAPPSVSLTGPVNGAVFTAPAAVTLSAAAADGDGTVSQVEFFQGPTLLATVTSEPYAFSVNNLPGGAYSFTARATDNRGASASSAPVAVLVNVAPTITLASPANNATFTAPASITLTAEVTDADGSIARVDFFDGMTLIGTRTAAPYSVVLADVPQGAYSLSARATDNQGAVAASAVASVTVSSGAAQIYFIHTDHLNTPRLITNNVGQAVWSWANDDPFGANVPNENPSGLGTFDCNLRLPGQYFDRETNLHYNYFRDYGPGIGRYVQSDPIGLGGGVNTYGYVGGKPLSFTDPLGLQTAWPWVASPGLISNRGPGPVHNDCGPEGGLLNHVVPNNPLGFPFHGCCSAHDKCYDNCKGPSQIDCDTDGCACFSRKCQTYVGTSAAACRRLAQEYCYRIMYSETAQSQFIKARQKCPGGHSC